MHQRLAGVRATTGTGPPAPPQRRCRDHPDLNLVLDHQRDQGGPDRDPAYEVGGPIDRVNHPASWPPTGVAALLAVDRVSRPAPAEGAADGVLDGSVGVRDLSQVRLGRNLQIERFETAGGERVGVVGQYVCQT